MIAIVDGGSTKCDWSITDTNNSQHFETQTIGFNPNLITELDILHEIKNNTLLSTHANSIEKIYFYGAGCGTPENQKKLLYTLQKHFQRAEISVDSDLVGAVYSVYRGQSAIIGILGTGSNSCYFDGQKITQKLPSLGYILGDEGSGNALGKAILKTFFMQKLPKDLSQKFQEKYQLTTQELLTNLYQRPKANAYLAQFSEFIFENKEHQFIQNIIKTEFRNYFDYQILPYICLQPKEIHFVGSIAYHYQEILKSVAEEFGIEIQSIIKKPIDGLVKFLVPLS